MVFGYVHEYKTGLDANPANIFSNITDADFIPPDTVEFQDGYFYIHNVTLKRFGELNY